MAQKLPAPFRVLFATLRSLQGHVGALFTMVRGPQELWTSNFTRVRGPQEFRTSIFDEWDAPQRPNRRAPPFKSVDAVLQWEGEWGGKTMATRLVTPPGGRRIYGVGDDDTSGLTMAGTAKRSCPPSIPIPCAGFLRRPRGEVVSQHVRPRGQALPDPSRVRRTRMRNDVPISSVQPMLRSMAPGGIC